MLCLLYGSFLCREKQHREEMSKKQENPKSHCIKACVAAGAAVGLVGGPIGGVIGGTIGGIVGLFAWSLCILFSSTKLPKITDLVCAVIFAFSYLYWWLLWRNLNIIVIR